MINVVKKKNREDGVQLVIFYMSRHNVIRVGESVTVDSCDLLSLLCVLPLSHICLSCRNFISLSQGYGYHSES